jgi:hypothetical protein
MFDYLIIDSVLMGYLVLNTSDTPDLKDTVKVGNKKVYKGFIKSFIETVDHLKTKHLKENGEVIFLFDNYESREQIKQLLRPLKESDSRKKINPSYKAQRRAQKMDFYSSLEIIRYYYMVNDKTHHTARIPNLEADDLVKPCIEYLQKKTPHCKILLVTNDSDWCRYLLPEEIQWLPELYGEPIGVFQFIKKFGFPPTEDSIILNKIIYGDEADNIKAVFPELKGDTRKFIMKNFFSITDLMFDVGKFPETKEYISLIKERETEIRSAYQMLATIPVTDEHFKSVFVTGRDSKVSITNIRNIIFGREESKEIKKDKFEFGGLKIPRYEPKEQ